MERSTLKSRYYTAKVTHSRMFPVKHSFLYDVFYFILDLDELESGALDSASFGYNRLRPFSIDVTDYMGKEKRSIKSKLIEIYTQEYNKQLTESTMSANATPVIAKPELIDRVELVTMPRYINLQFNPVSFYYCFSSDSTLLQIVVEINNTFGETHLYFPQPTIRDEQTPQLAINNEPYLTFAVQNKDFHVSPFNSLDGSYIFCFSDIRACFDIRINLLSTLKSTSLQTAPDDKDFILTTRLWSKWDSNPITNSSLLRLLVGYPITTLMTLPRIMFQAAKLHYSKGLHIYAKPNPPLDNTTIIIEPSPSQTFASKWFTNYLSTFPKGLFIISNPDGSTVTIDNSSKESTSNNDKNRAPTPENLLTESNKPISIKVLNYEFYWKLYLYHQSSGFSAKAIGLAYVANDFACDDMVSLIAHLCDLTTCTPIKPPSSKDSWGGAIKFIDPNVLSNYYNIQNTTAHCCINKIKEDQDIQDMYSLHYKHIVDKLNLKQSDAVLILEPGSLELVNLIGDIGCHIVVITKKIQLDNKKPGASNISFRYIRDDESYCESIEINDMFEKIISIEIDHQDCQLLELCQSHLKPNGVAYIQSITGPFHPYNEEKDIKPLLPPSYWQSYYLKKSNFESKYWGMIAKFTHNPFQLESRYNSVISALNTPKGYINGHFTTSNNNSNNNSNIPNISNDIVSMISSDQDCQLQLLELENIGDTYPEILENSLLRLETMKSSLLTDLQEEAMKNGCNLKMNEVDLLEIYRTIQFHHYYLIASFKTVWSVTKVLLQKKQSN